MPIYKGAVEVTSGNLYKGSTEIENAYKGSDSLFVNETTVSFANPTGQSLTYSTPSPQSSSGSPGTAFPATTFTVTTGINTGISGGSLSIPGLPSTLTATIGSIGNGPNTTAVITISGTFPTNSSLNTVLTVSGISLTTYGTVSLNYSGLGIPNTQQGTLSVSANCPGGYNNTDNGTVFTTQILTGNSTTINVVNSNPTPAQSTNMWQQTVFDRGLGSGSNTLAASNGATFSISTIPSNVTSYTLSSSSFVINGNTTLSVSGRSHSTINNKTWGYQIQATHSGSYLTFITLNISFINTAGGPWYNPGGSGTRQSFLNSQSGSFQSAMTPPGGATTQMKIAQVPFPNTPILYAYCQDLGSTQSNTYLWNYGGGNVFTTVTMS